MVINTLSKLSKMILKDKDKPKKRKISRAGEWMPVVGYEGLYVVHCTGMVKSVDRVVTHRSSGYLTLKGKPLRPAIGPNGYMTVSLYRDYTKKSHTVHRLVMMAFVGFDSNKQYINHIDGNKLNNDISNLEWVTFRENVSHHQHCKHKSSRYLGVSKDGNSWRACIHIEKQKINLGSHRSEEAARDAYQKALKYYNLENRYAQINK